MERSESWLRFGELMFLRGANPGEAAKYAPGWDQLGINSTGISFHSIGLSLLSGIVFGIAPALTGIETKSQQRAEGRWQIWFRRIAPVTKFTRCL